LQYCTTDSFSHSRQYSAERIFNLGRVGTVTVTVTNLGEELHYCLDPLSLSESTLSYSIIPVKSWKVLSDLRIPKMKTPRASGKWFVLRRGKSAKVALLVP